MMKKVTILSVLIILFNSSAFTQNQLSSSQLYLHRLLDSYKSEFTNATSKIEQEQVIKNFGNTVRAFIVDSMHQRTDSMTVRVGRIKRYKNNHIAAQLYFGNIEFLYYGNLDQLPEIDRLAVQQFIMTLKRNDTVRVSFVHQKGSIINSPDKKRFKPLTLFAFPLPLNYRSTIVGAPDTSLLP